MDNQTIVLPSARAIRQEQLHSENHTLFLPNYITMNEFIAKLCVVDGYRYIDDDSRVLLLLEASDFKEFSKLQIERNFFTFTKNASYIFNFFQELSAELYDIEKLSDADLYAEYEEHIEILQELYRRYENLCNEKKVLDKIFLPKLYKFNIAYAATHKKVTLSLDGYLTNFEFSLLEKASQYMQINIVFDTSSFNAKMQNRLEEYGFESFEVGYTYNLDFNDKTIVSKRLREKNNNVFCESFSETLLQVAFIKKKVQEFIDKGYKAENIAVVLPDEAIAEHLKRFDIKANYNFAMGESFSKSEIYTKIDATRKAIEQDSKENEARVQRVGEELYLLLHQHYYKSVEEVDFIELMREAALLFTNKTELKIYLQELYKFEKILPFMQNMKCKSVLNLFMQRLATQSIDDVRGGKITVLGVLETRSVVFDGVIIVDFDDRNVPKKSDKDMFLNTKIREHAGLPTMNDRENLQKHYYEMLISRSKEVAISYVSSNESKGSKFLKQLAIKTNNIYTEEQYAAILFNRYERKTTQEKPIVLDYSFKGVELSATKLKTYLTCKRKYYYKYIKHIKNHEIPRDIPKEYEIGVDVHNALKNLYTKKNHYSFVEELQRDLNRELEEVKGMSELEHYLISIQKKLLVPFCENEVKRFNEGWYVKHCEKVYKESFYGMNIQGQIDRIDKRENEIAVLDYKTGKYTLYNKNNFMEANDFQLEFYTLLASGEGDVVQSAFYDLKEGVIAPEMFLEQKMEILKSHIKELLRVESLQCDKTEDTKHCMYCEYRMMCGRD